MKRATNNELRVDFSAIARDVLVTAYEQKIAANGNELPPLFEGKPLDHLVLNIYEVSPASRTSSITAERLEVVPMDEGNIDEFRELPQFEDCPDDVFEHYARIASLIGQTTLERTVHLRGILPQGGIEATYVVDFMNGDQKTVNSFFEKPLRRTLQDGTVFARRALDYVKSPSFRRERGDVRTKIDERANRGTLEHTLGFIITPELPLNGHEPDTFLLRYYHEMAKRYTVSSNKLVVALRQHAPYETVEEYRYEKAHLWTAMQQAQRFLAEKEE